MYKLPWSSISVAVGFFLTLQELHPFLSTWIPFPHHVNVFLTCLPSSLHSQPVLLPALALCSLASRTHGLSFPIGLLFVLSKYYSPSHLLPPGWGHPSSLTDPQKFCPSSSETALMDTFVFQSYLTMVPPFPFFIHSFFLCSCGFNHPNFPFPDPFPVLISKDDLSLLG